MADPGGGVAVARVTLGSAGLLAADGAGEPTAARSGLGACTSAGEGVPLAGDRSVASALCDPCAKEL